MFKIIMAIFAGMLTLATIEAKAEDAQAYPYVIVEDIIVGSTLPKKEETRPVTKTELAVVGGTTVLIGVAAIGAITSAAGITTTAIVAGIGSGVALYFSEIDTNEIRVPKGVPVVDRSF